MRKLLSLIFVCASLLLSGHALAQSVITRTGIENPDKWINTYFAQGKVPPFSFAYEEISSGKFLTECLRAQGGRGLHRHLDRPYKCLARGM